MTINLQATEIGSKVLGFTVVQCGGRRALGMPNGRGGVSVEKFRHHRGTNTVVLLERLGITAHIKPSGSPSTFTIVF